MKRKVWAAAAVGSMFLVILGFWIGAAITMRLYGGSWAAAGVIGDSFGAANSLFAGLALVGVLYTLNQQNSDIKTREKNFYSESENSRKNLSQLILSTRIQIITTLINEHRKSIIELRPDLNHVPSSENLILSIIERVESDERKGKDIKEKNEKVFASLKELIDLQRELRDVHKEIKSMSSEKTIPS